MSLCILAQPHGTFEGVGNQLYSLFEILSSKSQRLKEHWTTPRTRNSNKTMGETGN